MHALKSKSLKVHTLFLIIHLKALQTDLKMKGLKVRANFFKDLKLSTVLDNAGETTSWTGERDSARGELMSVNARTRALMCEPCAASYVYAYVPAITSLSMIVVSESA